MGEFGTAVNCMDGRVQEPVIRFMKAKYGIDYIDMVTMAGPDKILAENKEFRKVNAIRERISISVNKHKSKHILMAGHADCAGNPVEKETHIEQILKSSSLIKSWFPEILVLPVWIDENREVNVLAEG